MERQSSERSRRPILWLALAGLQIFWAITRTFDIYDEMWFLQVVQRMLGGEVLYRDVYFNTTPLSAYGTAGLIALSGVQLIVVKLVVAACILTSLALVLKIIERVAGRQRRPPPLVIALVLVYGNYPSLTPYTPLAVTFYLFTFDRFLVWMEKRDLRSLFWSGIAAGLCFATKYNAGLLALAALGMAVIAISIVERASVTEILRRLAMIGAAFAICVGAVAIVVSIQGGFDRFIEYAFRNKTIYVAVGAASYMDGIRMLIEATREPLSLDMLMKVYRLLILAVPPITLLLWIVYWLRSSSQQKGLATSLGLFLLAGYAITYPRAAGATTFVIPILAAIGSIAWQVSAAPRSPLARRACIAVAGGWLSFALLVMLVNPVRRMMSDEWRLSRIPHCRWILAARDTDDRLLAAARDLRTAVATDEAFIQTMTAGFYYLASGIRNPTPYDLPATTTFGLRGQEKVIALIESGHVRKVAVFPEALGSQMPRQLLRYIESEMIPERNHDLFTVYSRPERQTE